MNMKQRYVILVAIVIIPVAIVIISGDLHHGRVSTRPVAAKGAAVDGMALGKAFAPVLASVYADAWMAAAGDLEQGTSTVEAQKTLQKTWKDGRVKAFMTRVAPSFSIVLPEGSEPTSPEHRARVVALWRSFAGGLKGGK
jgi:hypothetical protein